MSSHFSTYCRVALRMIHSHGAQALLCCLFIPPALNQVTYAQGVQSAEGDRVTPTIVQQIETIEVAGNKDSTWQKYTNMRAGLEAYKKHRPALAPESSLRFVVESSSVPIEKIRIAIVGRDAAVDIKVEQDGTFVLPDNLPELDEEAELRINQKLNLVSWRPSVLSFAQGEGRRRLGDLRLECEVMWAVTKKGAGFALRAMAMVTGSICTSSKFHWQTSAPKNLTDVVFSTDHRRESISAIRKVASGAVYLQLPLHDQGWGNDTKVEFISALSQNASKTLPLAIKPTLAE